MCAATEAVFVQDRSTQPDKPLNSRGIWIDQIEVHPVLSLLPLRDFLEVPGWLYPIWVTTADRSKARTAARIKGKCKSV